MLSSILPERWRGRIVYGLMSAFVAWHALALIVGPAPQGSVIARAVRPYVEPYLNLIYLNVGWGFFAPVGMTSEFRYVVVDEAGKKHTFMPTRGLHWYHPSKLWIKDRYRTISQFSEHYGDALMANYCRKHASLKPVEIILLDVIQEKLLRPKDHLAGKTSFDPEFATTHTLRSKKCSKP